MLAVNDKPKIGSLFPARSAWQYLAVSPDGKRAAAMRERALEVIDLRNGSIRTLSEDLQEGAWSPDGRWLAAIDWKKGRTVLMDATTLVPRRILRESNADWSPDSRYLLGVKKFDLCGPYSGTFEATNIETSKAVTIKSSHCKVNRATSGSVSSKIAQD
jgi:Tol biopolymer transport system component